MIRLVLEDNNSRHDDLVLKFSDGEHRCDTYYFTPGKECESIEAVRCGIRTLLTQWLTVVEAAAETDTVYLPFDFSDQCSVWVRCQFGGESVQLDVGWSSIEGWPLVKSWIYSPEDVVGMAHKVPDFGGIENASRITMDRASLVAAIGANIGDYE